MAYEKTRRQSFNPANITVNRGNATARLGQQVFSDKMQLIDTTQNLISTKLDEYIVDQKLEGTKLAESSEIITQRETFTVGNEQDGYEEVTYDIPVSYERDESLIKTKWSANTYDEQIEKTYTDSLIGSVNEITMAEKNRMKMITNYDDTVSDIKAKYEYNMQDSLAALRETVPEQYRNFYDGSTKKLVTAAITELSNRQVTNRESYFSASSKQKEGEWLSQHVANFLSGEKDIEGNLVQLTKLEGVKKNQEEALRNRVPGAKVWLEETYPAQKEMIKLGELLSPYFKVDYKDSKSILRTIHNHNALEQMFNNESDALLFIDEKGDKKNFTLENIKKLGFNVDNVVDRKKYQTTISRAKELLREQLTKTDNENYSEKYIATVRNEPLGYRVKQDTKQKEILSNLLMDKDSKLNLSLVPEFVIYKNTHGLKDDKGQPLADIEFTVDNMDELDKQQLKMEYYTYVGGKYQILPTNFNEKIVRDLNNILQHSVKGEVTREDLLNFINHPTNMIARNILMKNKSNNYKSITILDNIPGISPDQLKLAQRIYETYAVIPDGNQASQRLANVLLMEYELSKPESIGGGANAFIKRTGYENQAAINTAIDEVLLDDYSSKYFKTDTILSRHFTQVVKRQVYQELMVSAESTQQDEIKGIIPNRVHQVVKRLEESGIYGKSKYTVNKGFTNDPNENTELKDKEKIGYGMHSLDKFFDKEESDFPDSTPYPASSAVDGYRELNDEQFEWLRAKAEKNNSGLHWGKTKSYSFFQNDIVKQVKLAYKENKQFDNQTKIELGVNTFLEPVSDRVLDPSKVLYRAVFYSSPGAEPYFMKNESGEITYSRLEIENKSKANEKIETKVDEFSIEKSTSAKIKEISEGTLAILNPAYSITINGQKYKLSEEKRKYYQNKIITDAYPSKKMENK